LGKTVLARYKGDRLVELLEPVDLEIGKEVTVTIIDLAGATDPGAFDRAAGSWAGNVDVDVFLKRRAETKHIRKARPKL
jgi:hypothetical protein